jgi:hypothetical protein
VTSAPAPAPRGRIARGWRNFRRWRRQRPFWGGLFCILAGLQILSSTQLTLGDLQLKVGLEGFQAYLIPAILILAGLLTWVTPAHRIFYGVLAALVAVYSLIGVNLGGFFIGMVLGIIGGGLSASWTPVRREPPAGLAEEPPAGFAGEPDDADATTGDGPAEPDATVDELLTGPLTDVLPAATTAPIPRPRPAHERTAQERPTPSGSGTIYPGGTYSGSGSSSNAAARGDEGAGESPPGGGALPRRSPRLLAITLVPVTLAAVLTALDGSHPAFAAPCPTTAAAPAPTKAAPATSSPAPAPAPAPALPSPTASPAPAASSPAAVSSPAPLNPVGDAVGAVVDAIGNLVGLAAAEPTPTPSGTSAPAPAPKTVAPRAPAPRQPATTCQSPGGTTTKPRTLAAAADQPTVALTAGRMTGSKVSMSGLSFDGVVELPTRDGTVRVLQFSMASSITDDFLLRIPEANGTTTALRSSALTVSGNVKFYASRFQGKVFGLIDMTFTPDSPPPVTVSETFFTDPDIQLVFVDCQQLNASDLRATVVSG